MPGGRPTDYKPEYCEKLIEWSKDGHSLVWIGSQLDVTRETLYEWGRVHPEFSDAMNVGRAHCQAWWEQKGRDGLADPRFNAALWSKNMGPRFKQDWSEKSQLEITGKDGGPVEQSLSIRFVKPGE